MNSFLRLRYKTLLFFLLSHFAFPSVYTLENGMKVILEERHTTEFVSLQAFVKAGSIYEDEYIGSGISHLVEHMLFKGTKKRGPQEIAGEIEKEGGRINAFTSFDKTVYKITIPSQSMYVAIDILKDILFFPEFPEDELVKEKDVILKEIETRDNSPEDFLLRCLFQEAFTTHPVRYPIIGYKELFKELKRKDLIAYHKERYIPSNIAISACGDFEERELLDKIKRVFSSIPRKQEKAISIPNEPRQVSKRTFYTEKPFNLAYLAMGFHIPSITHPDIHHLDLLSAILGKGRTGRLYKSLVDDKGLVLSIESFSYTPAFPGLFGISAKMHPNNLRLAEKEILREIERIKKDGVSQKELNLAKRKLIADIYSLEETIEKRASVLGESFLDTGNPYFLDEYVKNIEGIKPSEIRDAAKLYLNSNNMTFALLSPEKLKEEKEKIAVKKREIKKGYLPNGLTYLISPSNTKGLVSIYALFKGGRLVEKEGKEGISNLTSSLLLAGTKNKGRARIAEEIESLGGSISSYGGRNSFGISISILPENVDKGLAILKEIIKEPTFDEEEIKREKKRVILSLKARSDEMFSFCLNMFLKTIYKTHPYSISELGREESIESITKSDLLSFYNERIMPNNMVLTVFGGVNPEKIEKSIKRHFQRLEQRRLYKPQPYPNPQLEEDIELRMKNKRFSQAGIMMGFLGSRITDEDRFSLELISSILSRQGGRLFNSLREEEGLVYYTDSFNIFGLDPGCFIIHAQTSEKNVSLVCKKIEKEIARLKDEDVSSDELSSSKTYLIGEKEALLEDNSRYGFEAGLCELYGMSFNEVERYKERLDKIDPPTIKQIARKYFDKKAIVIIVP
ncbi:MAG: pitrilysin family protein [bacterium]